jgi:glycosyl transferase, family 25
MRIFVINLARRADRMAAMAAQLDRLGLSFERFDAIDAKTVDPAELGAPFAAHGAMADLTPGDKACTTSHMHLWRRIADGPDNHAVILEDDVLLSDAASKFLSGDSWIPPAAGLIKLERFGDLRQLTFVGLKGARVFDREIAPLLSRHPGSGGYVISREKAALLAAMTQKIALPIDQLLFNPAYSPVFRALQPWQMVPAILEQRAEVGGETDIRRSRLSLRRRLMRHYRAMRVLPGQIASVLFGNARAIKIGLG